ncbi:MAG: glycosyltransferase family 25 protein [Ferruginibacter sp.]
MSLPDNAIQFLQQYFDKILVVSVPRFTDRHEKVKQQLTGLPFDFFWGADKLALNYDVAKTDGTYDEQRAQKLQRQGKALNLGEIACSLSHRNLYTAMIGNGWEKVLILEDDVLPLIANMDALPAAMQELPQNWELVYLGYLKHEKVTAGLKAKQFFYKIISAMGLMAWSYKMVSNLLPKPYSKHLRKAGFHDCTHAYAITLAAAKKLLAIQTPVVYRADDLLSATIMKGELNAFITDPKFFDQEIFHNAAIVSEIKT